MSLQSHGRSPDSQAEEIGAEMRRHYEQYAAGLLRYALVVMQGQDGAADGVQEVFLRYFIERSYGRSIDNPRAWLYHVLRNYLLDRLRTARTNRETPANGVERVPDERQNPEERLQRKETAREIAEALTPRERECLRMRIEGLCYAEIAEVLGIRTGTVGALLAHAHTKIRRIAANVPRGGLPVSEAELFWLTAEGGYSS